MLRHHQNALRIRDGLDSDFRSAAQHAAKQGGKGGFSRILASAKSHKAHWNGHP